ncbi:uncharacterized protein PAC_04756 [Phialocephala subalpina]|uniref:2EXR domain-containing protein n=1 Tax=Phialocephala subalpina TaxID=576137 RepID=A0A1L7WQ36_9HELO|nr:uncharacterized protein PAC_04756 [Phialocephala subalpina]
MARRKEKKKSLKSTPKATVKEDASADSTLTSSVSSLDLSSEGTTPRTSKSYSDLPLLFKNPSRFSLDRTSEVPGEIRNMIWGFCITRRVVKVFDWEIQYSSQPLALYANQESRSLISPYYHRIERKPANKKDLFKNKPKYLLFNPENDLLCIGHMNPSHCTSIHNELPTIAKYVYISIESLKNQTAVAVALNLESQHSSSFDYYGGLRPCMKEIEKLEHVFVVLSGKHKNS